MENKTSDGSDLQFCHDHLWDTDYLLNSSWPRFTDCFQHTVLIYVPFALLWLILPIILCSLDLCNVSWTKLRSQSSLLSRCQVVLLVLLSACSLLIIVERVTSHEENDWLQATIAFYLAYAIRFTTYFLVMIVMVIEEASGKGSSPGKFLPFLMTLVFCDIVPFYSKIINENLCYSYSYYALQEILLKMRNINNQTFIKGWRKELTKDDLFDINPRDACDTLVPPFEEKWKKESAKWKETQRCKHLSSAQNEEDVELLETGQSDAAPDDKEKKEMPSLLKVLFKLKGGQLLVGMIQKIVSDIFLLVGPVILSLLINYANNSEEEHTWHGYSLAVLLFVTQVFKSVFRNESFWTGELVGLNLKSTLITTIYKKVLTMGSMARQQISAGEIINLMSADCNQVQILLDTVYLSCTTPLQAVAVVAIVYQYIGWTVFVGLGTLLLVVPVNAVMGSRRGIYHKEIMKLKDERLQLINESLSSMKVIKLYAWERVFEKKISDVRQKETDVMMKIAYMRIFGSIFFSIIPLLVTLSIFSAYIMQEGNVLDANKVFVTLSFFNILKVPLMYLSGVFTWMYKAIVSVRRINKFLCTGDINPNNITERSLPDCAVDVDNGSFAWDNKLGPTLKGIQLKIDDGSLSAVVGTVGCGKSSLMSAIIGEMEKLSGRVSLRKDFAYVPQEAWIQNATIRDNILFGKPYNSVKYQQVVSACALERDLQILSAGDMTEIGEKGINLSGGQKQRVSLARAVYSEAEIYIMDDPLSAVDSHVGKHIFNNVISNSGILKGKTRILVTHGIQWLPMVDNVIVMENGQISESGTYETLMSHNGSFAQLIQTFLLKTDEEEEGTDDDSVDEHGAMPHTIGDGNEDQKEPTTRHRIRRQTTTQSHGEGDGGGDSDVGRLIEDETTETGKVKNSVYLMYLNAGGAAFMVVTLILYLFYQAVSACSNFWLSDWTKSAAARNTSIAGNEEFDDEQKHYLTIYFVFAVAQTLFIVASYFIYWIRMVIASRKLHLRTLKAMFRCPMSFFDTSPRGRILNRFSTDIEMIDDVLPTVVMEYVLTLADCLVTVVVIAINIPLFLTVLFPIVILLLLFQGFYVPTSRQIKRIQAVSQSLVYSHASETLSGTSTIRAYGKTDRFVEKVKQILDDNQSLAYLSTAAYRATNLYLEMIANFIILGATLFAVLTPGISGSIVGLAISYAIQSSDSFVWMVRQRGELEANAISIERLKEYSQLTPEADWTVENRKLPIDWPTKGKLEFKDYMTRYRPGLDLVLHGINCCFEPGEKIGVVGRTGAGKSSLALAMFRLIEASHGAIYVDDVAISDVGLHDVRSRLTILPQDPMLFLGSLRMNLDPSDQYTDDQLWDALTTAHLKDFVRSLPQGLDFQVGEEGQSMSVGQRQLVCLARALLKKSKILILDEATAAVDVETDKLIQDTIRVEFQHSTVISIAHRLNTILDYDRVMVLDNGLIIELDTPSNLLAKTDTAFYAMAKEANLV